MLVQTLHILWYNSNISIENSREAYHESLNLKVILNLSDLTQQQSDHIASLVDAFQSIESDLSRVPETHTQALSKH